MKKNKDHKFAPVSDSLLISLHLIFIIFSFVFAFRAPFYLGFLLIFFHKAHEIYFGECYLTLLQQRYGYSGDNDDFFYHLFHRLNIKVKRNLTKNIHLAIKTIILIIVLFKTLLYFDIFY
ncbi:hypothetical protein LJ207_11475 [Halanaerobium sp. Z-7514]|uniref:Uncharacterized protein n=1 Tax=Halanaerobium polyolivorans TaxID=2886943 RepID=A0AAW4X290_9FIRM|nr:hypothetical protein [Halanaerobium polyolivorans]MCC3145935.1 hypothetical protein [Halanaerobium polyolivorans]RQD75013.1 MAG: hypothetical protein D5S01_05795 [Halanaerobium sp. MSAO_Bac5]